PRSKHAADAAERQRSAKESGAKRHAAGIVELAGARARRIEMSRRERVAGRGNREPGAEDFVDDDGAVWLLKALDEQVELVALMQFAAHIDLVLEDVGE